MNTINPRYNNKININIYAVAKSHANILYILYNVYHYYGLK